MTTARNDITGDKIRVSAPTKQFKKKTKTKVEEMDPLHAVNILLMHARGQKIESTHLAKCTAFVKDNPDQVVKALLELAK